MTDAMTDALTDAMTEAASASGGLSLNHVLAIAASALLVFVSAGVIYLSTIEWRDRRRRQQPATSLRSSRR
jgi:hypothetical protein